MNPRTRNTLLAAQLLAGVFAAAVFGQGQEEPRREVKDAFEQAPARERERPNPFAGQEKAVQAGQKLFRRHCANCHGKEGHGTDKAPPLRSATVQTATPGELAWFLKNGNLRRGMPSWSGLPEPQRWQLVTYIQSLHLTEAAPPVTEPGPPSGGIEVSR